MPPKPKPEPPEIPGTGGGTPTGQQLPAPKPALVNENTVKLRTIEELEAARFKARDRQMQEGGLNAKERRLAREVAEALDAEIAELKTAQARKTAGDHGLKEIIEGASGWTPNQAGDYFG